MPNTCPTTPYGEKTQPFTAKESVMGSAIDPFSIIQICAHINQENGFAILDENHNYILIS